MIITMIATVITLHGHFRESTLCPAITVGRYGVTITSNSDEDVYINALRRFFKSVWITRD